MNESRFIEYPNAWCPLTDPHRALQEAIITLGFAKDAIERAEAEPRDEWRAAIAVSALKWIVERLDSNFTEDFETRCSRTQDAFDIVRAGIAAREAIKNIKQEGGE